MNYCARCGAPLPPTAQFCPGCGADLAHALPATPAPAPAPAPAPPPASAPAGHRRVIWIVPLVIVAVAGLAWLLLAGLPFGEGDRPPAARPEPETIAEGTVSRETATLVDVPEAEPSPSSPPSPPPRRSEIGEPEAIATLRGFLTAREFYKVPADCVTIASRGYRNAGYTLDVVDSCASSRLLGRWRVDSKTREIFRQREDGRYLRP